MNLGAGARAVATISVARRTSRDGTHRRGTNGEYEDARIVVSMAGVSSWEQARIAGELSLGALICRWWSKKRSGHLVLWSRASQQSNDEFERTAPGKRGEGGPPHRGAGYAGGYGHCHDSLLAEGSSTWGVAVEEETGRALEPELARWKSRK